MESGPHEPVVVLDALQLVHLDTSGLDALRQLHKAVLLRGGTLRLENLQPQPREVIERSGFADELARAAGRRPSVIGVRERALQLASVLRRIRVRCDAGAQHALVGVRTTTVNTIGVFGGCM